MTDRVLAALRLGPLSSQQLHAALGEPASRDLRGALHTLEAQGLARLDGGRWVLTESDLEAYRRAHVAAWPSGRKPSNEVFVVLMSIEHYPWCTMPEIAQRTGVSPRDIGAIVGTRARRGQLQRRGTAGHYQYAPGDWVPPRGVDVALAALKRAAKALNEAIAALEAL